MGERDETVDNDGNRDDVTDAEEVAEPSEVVEPEIVDPQAELKTKLEEAQARLRTVSKAYTDLQKEMNAFRERMENQSRARGERQAFETVQTMLEPVQNLKRSLAAKGDAEALHQGIEMVLHQFMDALGKLGLTEVPGEGCAFDPTYHEALAVMPVVDPAQDGRVLQVHRNGYAVNGKVLQAAQVVIGKHEKPAEA
ncbi:MAG: nucleotide exchange factor GrpE [Myxococcales bacterium]|nr:nucleotide exchange factor GrpE [Myxococcales bacterium]MCB9668062.1 nucleotide exchange factor GrpE [Alphaproteobacteria bacterium]